MKVWRLNLAQDELSGQLHIASVVTLKKQSSGAICVEV
jgi:hypothetical protein